jgi:hypothetical protein
VPATFIVVAGCCKLNVTAGRDAARFSKPFQFKSREAEPSVAGQRSDAEFQGRFRFVGRDLEDEGVGSG